MAVVLVSYLGGTDLVPLNDPAYKDAYGVPIYEYINQTQSELVTKTVDQNFADKTLSRPVLKDYGELWQTVTSSSGAVTIDFTSGNHASLTLSENVTSITLSNPTATGKVCPCLLRVVQDSTPRTITWPASVKWAGGTAPTLSTGSGDIDLFVLQTWDGGTSYYASIVGQDFS